MKKHINILLAGMVFFGIMACKEEKIVDQVINSTTSGGILRNLGETNSLDSANAASTYSILLEAQDASGGNQLQEVRVNVGFTSFDTVDINDVTVTLFATIPRDAFTLDQSTTANGLPAATFSTTYGALLSHVSLASANVGDRFAIDFEYVMADGRIFNVGNATTDVVRTGFFSFFNSQFRYAASVGDPQRLTVDDFETKNQNKLGRLRNPNVDTVFVTFDRDITSFVTPPAIVEISAVGATDGVLGALTQVTGNPDTYFALYTAGVSPGDTIDFAISGGSTTAGFVMKNDTLKNAYIIDNLVPNGSVGATRVSTVPNSAGTGNNFLSVAFDLEYEPLAADTLSVQIVDNNVGGFVTQTLSTIVEQGQELIQLSFVPQNASGVALPEGALDFDVTITDISDVVGNTTTDVVNVQLGN